MEHVVKALKEGNDCCGHLVELVSVSPIVVIVVKLEIVVTSRC